MSEAIVTAALLGALGYGAYTFVESDSDSDSDSDDVTLPTTPAPTLTPCTMTVPGEKWITDQTTGGCTFDGCADGYTLQSGNCVPDNFNDECKKEDGKVFKVNNKGECVWNGYSCDRDNGWKPKGDGTGCFQVTDCQFGAWINQGNCVSDTGMLCGKGTQTQKRSILAYHANCDTPPAGRESEYETSREVECDLGTCPVGQCLYGDYEFSDICSKPCADEEGPGKRVWTRRVVQSNNQPDCVDVTGEITCNDIPCMESTPCIQKCEDQACFDDLPWGECSRSCGGGKRIKRNTVIANPNGPLPSDRDMARCFSKAVTVESCNPTPCEGGKKDCVMKAPSDWSSCSAQSCGDGIRYRTWEIEQLDQNGGEPCPAQIEIQTCSSNTMCSTLSHKTFNTIDIPFKANGISGTIFNHYVPLIMTGYVGHSQTHPTKEDGKTSFLTMTHNYRDKNMLKLVEDRRTRNMSLPYGVPEWVHISPLMTFHRKNNQWFMHAGKLANPSLCTDKDFMCVRDPASNKWYVKKRARFGYGFNVEGAIAAVVKAYRAERESFDSFGYTNLWDCIRTIGQTNCHLFFVDSVHKEIFKLKLQYNVMGSLMNKDVSHYETTLLVAPMPTSNEDNVSAEYFSWWDEKWPDRDEVTKANDVDEQGNPAPTDEATGQSLNLSVEEMNMEAQNIFTSAQSLADRASSAVNNPTSLITSFGDQ